MVDQDLDALLVGALYGELGPADEARLAAHLESHPTDRTALDELRSTRKAFVDSRLFEMWFEPPPAVSALLVQEAARRAPKATENESWFARFARSFMRHPAMAAAMMLVVVVGVAGTLYMSKGAELAAPRASELEQQKAAPIAANTASTGAAAGSAAAVAVAESPQAVSPTQPTGAAVGGEHGMAADVDDKKLALGKYDRDERNYEIAKKPVTHAIKGGIAVDNKDYEPKELEKARVADDESAADQPARKNEAQAQGSKDEQGPAPATAQATAPSSTVGMAPGAGGGATNAQPADPWAREQVQSVESQVRQGHCPEAAQQAAAIQARSPDVYATYIANSRALKQCEQYIADAVQKQEAKTAAAKAAKAKPAATTDSK